MTIAPAGAFCAVNERGQLMPDHCYFHRHDVERSMPPNEKWKVVRVVIDVMESWEERDAAAKAVDALPDAVACALLGADELEETP